MICCTKTDDIKPHEPDKKKGKFSNKLRSMQKDVRNKKTKPNEIEQPVDGNEEEITLTVQG